MIFITGAAGKTGRAVIRALVARGESISALVHRPEQTQAILELGAQEVVTGDMRDSSLVATAMRGMQAVYHICPNVSPDEVSIGKVILYAARAAGVERFVYHSVLHPQAEEMPHHWQKMRVEELIHKSGLAFTILQPAAYMQNVLAQRTRIAVDGIYPVPYGVETRMSMVDLEDVAEVAAVVLTQKGHHGASYELVGSELMTPNGVALSLSQVLGRPVRAQQVSLLDWERQACRTGLGDFQVATLIKMFQYYDQYGFWGSPRVLCWLLGRPPTPWRVFVERVEWTPN